MKNILLIDKSALSLRSLRQLFDSNGYTVTLALDSNKAKEHISSTRFDLIVYNLYSDDDFEDYIILESKKTPILVLTNKSEYSRSLPNHSVGLIDFFFFKNKSPLEIQKHSSALLQMVDLLLNPPKKSKPAWYEFKSFSRKKIVVIAASTGGPQTVELLLSSLPASIPVPILVVQHMPIGFTQSFAMRLNNVCEINVKEAFEGDELSPGTALIAPAGYHMELISEVQGAEGTIHLNQDPPELGVRPCANKLFTSVSKIFKENTIGVVLTGMGTDGTIGSKEIKTYGGTIIAQAKESCILYGMPKSIIENNLADEVVEIDNLAVALIQLVDL